MTASLWYTNGAEFHADCLSWCTADGSMPAERPGDSQALDEIMSALVRLSDFFTIVDDSFCKYMILNFQLSGSVPSKAVDFNPKSTTTEIILSKRLLYHFQANSTGNIKFREASNYQAKLKWVGDGTCQARFVCAVLAGNPNGDYGLSIGEDQGVPVKYPSQSINQSIGSGQSFVLNLWHSSSPKMDLSCYMYCTEDGELPVRNSEGTISQSEVESMVSCNTG